MRNGSSETESLKQRRIIPIAFRGPCGPDQHCDWIKNINKVSLKHRLFLSNLRKEKVCSGVSLILFEINGFGFFWVLLK